MSASVDACVRIANLIHVTRLASDREGSERHCARGCTSSGAVLDYAGRHRLLPGSRPGGSPMSVHSQRGHCTILLAEDEVLLRELGETILRQAGYTVVTVYRREELNSLLKSYAGAIDVLLTDVVMPEISGQELVTLVRTRWPNIQVIYMSGYSSDDIADIDPNANFLQKPFTPAELMEKIRKAIGR